jgi:phospholipase C
VLSLNSCGGNSATNTGPIQPGKLKHLVVIFQENRTPDNLFQDPVLIAKGADIANSGVNSSGQTIPLSAGSLGVDYDPDHSHPSFLKMYDNGKMDGADLIKISCSAGATNCPPPNPQFWYVSASYVQPYFQMAEQHRFGDRMFQTNQGPSFPAHQFIISGTSAPAATSDLFVAENAQGVSHASGLTGCLAPPAEFVYLIDPSGVESSTSYPCFDHPTLTDELSHKGISWRYYSPSAGSLWTGPNAMQHMWGPNVPPPNATACVGSDWTNSVVIPETQVHRYLCGGNSPKSAGSFPLG